MSVQLEVKIPDVGEAADVEVIEVCVNVGDQVSADDVLVVLESDKASMEVLAEHTGQVAELKVVVGDKVETGSLVSVLEVDESVTQPSAEADVDVNAKTEKSQITTQQSTTTPVASAIKPQSTPTPPASSDTQSRSVYASPVVRRLAREFGVDLTQVSATGNRGRILKEDVQNFVKARLSASDGASAGIPEIPAVDFSKFGPVEIEPVGRVMLRGATHLHRSWLNLPQVTQHGEADITQLEAFRKAQKNKTGQQLTLLPFILKVCAATLLEHRKLNGSLAEGGRNYVFKNYIHLGIAVDTEEGLLVPVIRNVDQKNIWELSAEIGDLVTRTRNRKLKPDDLQGASFTVSSLGAIGGTGFTPLVNAPEVAILGVARSAWKPVYKDGDFVARLMLPLSLSYDHRAVNGADGGRFMVSLVERFEDCRLLLM